MQTAGTPFFLWIDGQLVNLSLCQGVCYFEDEEDGWVVSFNMMDDIIYSHHGTEEEAKAALEAIYDVLDAKGCMAAALEKPE